MPKDTIAFQCPDCKVNLKVSSSRANISCPKCNQPINVAQAMVLSSSRRKKRRDSPAILRKNDNKTTTAKKSRSELGFNSYFIKHWKHSHGHWLLPVLFAIVFAVPLLSCFKPAIGFRGQLISVAGLIVLTVMLFLVYSAKRILGFYFGGERAVPDDTSSKFAAFAYCGAVVVIFPFGPLMAIEYVMPEKGVLVNIFPSLEEGQSKILAKLNLTEKKEDTLLAVVTKGAVASDDSVSDPSGESNTEPDAKLLKTEDDSEASSRNAADSKFPPESNARDDEDTPGFVKQKKQPNVPIKTTNDPKNVAIVLSDDDTPKQEKKKKQSTDPATKTTNPIVMNVIAEGVGVNSDEALKDAFRNAVRQVVGALIDAETLIKNDEIISDKVLTYSDGFIPTYKLLSESHSKGLFRKKIMATVKRRSLIAKLKAANVTIKIVDGQGLFATAITNAEAKSNATALLKKALKDLPTYLTAKVVNKSPEKMYDSIKSEIIVDIEFSVDIKAYAVFVKRLEQVLKKISVSQTSLLVVAKVTKDGVFENKNIPQLLGPKLDGKRRLSCVWVCVFNNKTNTTTRWNGYVVDVDFAEVTAPLQQAGMDTWKERVGSLSTKTVLTTSALDADGNLVVEDEFELLADSSSHDPRDLYSVSNQLGFPFLRKLVIRTLGGEYRSFDTQNAWSVVNLFNNQSLNAQQETHLAPLVSNLFIAPYSFTVKEQTLDYIGNRIVLFYRTKPRITRRLKVSLGELKKIRNIRCKVSYQSEPNDLSK